MEEHLAQVHGALSACPRDFATATQAAQRVFQIQSPQELKAVLEGMLHEANMLVAYGSPEVSADDTTHRRVRQKSSGHSVPREATRHTGGGSHLAPTRMLHLLGHLQEVVDQVVAFLPQQDLCRMGAADNQFRVIAFSPRSWQGRTLSWSQLPLTRSDQRVLLRGEARWKLVQGIALPNMRPSKAFLQQLRSVFPNLRTLHLADRSSPEETHRCILEAFANLECLRIQSGQHFKVFSDRPLLQLKTLDVRDAFAFHRAGPGIWSCLPHVVPNIEILRVPLGCWGAPRDSAIIRTNDECMLPLCSLPMLRELDASEVYTLTDACIQTLGSLARLERLCLRSMGRLITGQGLRFLAQGGAPLSYVDFTVRYERAKWPNIGRTTISEDDAAEFRSRRPEVEILISCWSRRRL